MRRLIEVAVITHRTRILQRKSGLQIHRAACPPDLIEDEGANRTQADG